MELSEDRDQKVIKLAISYQKQYGLIPRLALLKALRDMRLPATDQDELRLHAEYMIRYGKLRTEEKAAKKKRLPRTKTWCGYTPIKLHRLARTFADASQPKEKD